jgi:ACR3 family arsenite transporter
LGRRAGGSPAAVLGEIAYKPVHVLEIRRIEDEASLLPAAQQAGARQMRKVEGKRRGRQIEFFADRARREFLRTIFDKQAVHGEASDLRQRAQGIDELCRFHISRIMIISKHVKSTEKEMSAPLESAATPVARSPLGIFERYLTVWVALCIVIGIALGQVFPGLFQAIGRMELARVNVPVGLLIWVMIVPMLVKIDFGALDQVKSQWRGIGVTLFVNWAVKPFSMALLGWLFIRHVFASYLPAGQHDSYIAGLILLAAAPCTAMVFVWSKLTDGDPYFTLTQVALNDTIMIFAFAPIVGLLLGIASITVPWATLLASVVLYIVIPVVLAQLWRRALLGKGRPAFEAAMARIGPWSIGALLLTLVLLFAFQGEANLAQPLIIAMLAAPILIQVFFNSALAYWLNRRIGEKHSVAGPSALIGASNFFELAVAAAISLFGFNSGAALATVVGVLIEVPVMLSVVAIVNATRPWYERRPA